MKKVAINSQLKRNSPFNFDFARTLSRPREERQLHFWQVRFKRKILQAKNFLL